MVFSLKLKPFFDEEIFGFLLLTRNKGDFENIYYRVLNTRRQLWE